MNARTNNPPVHGVTPQSWGFAEDYVEMHENTRASRTAGVEMGLEPLSQGSVAALQFFARLTQARAIVEIGTGTGTSGLALYSGMSAQGILTSIDPEADRQASARKAFTAAGVLSRRIRLIAGTPLDILANLRDGAYDLVFVNGDKLEYVEYVAQALRLLRHGGVVIVNDMLWNNKVANAENEEDETVIIREALQSVSETEEFTPVLLPVGNGLLVAIKE